MTLVYRAYPVEEYQWETYEQRSPPWRTENNDPGNGAGTSNDVMVYGVGKVRIGSAAVPNPGSLQWFPLGHHTWGRQLIDVRYPFGPIAQIHGFDHVTGLVGQILASFGQYDHNGAKYLEWPQWFMVCSNSVALLPIGWSPAGKLLAGYGDSPWVWELEWDAIPRHLATRGQQIAAIPNFRVQAPYYWNYNDSGNIASGNERHTIDWLSQVWVFQPGSAGTERPGHAQLWGFTTNEPPDGRYFEIPIPANVRNYLGGETNPVGGSGSFPKNNIGNMSIAVDKYYQRIFALQWGAVPNFNNQQEPGWNVQPAIVWQILPGALTGSGQTWSLNTTWTQMGFAAAPPTIRPIATEFTRPAWVYVGGMNFMHIDSVEPAVPPCIQLPAMPLQPPIGWPATTTGGKDSNDTYFYNGGTKHSKIQIPPSVTHNRTVTNITQRFFPAPVAPTLITPGNAKDQRYAQYGPNGRIYCLGGDTGNFRGDGTDSYSPDIFSLFPDDPSSFQHHGYMPWRVDQVGMAYDAGRSGIWWSKNVIIQQPADGRDICLYHPATNTFDHVYTRGDFALVGPGFPPKNHWHANEESDSLVFDPGTNRLIKICGDSSGDVAWIIILSNLDGGPGVATKEIQLLNRFATGSAPPPPATGSQTDYVHPGKWNFMGNDEHYAIDQATGNIYLAHWQTRMILRVATREPADQVIVPGQWTAKMYYTGVQIPMSPQTQKMLCSRWIDDGAGGFMVIYTRSTLGQGELYTWKPGEPKVTHHTTFDHSTGRWISGVTMCSYIQGGQTKLFFCASVPTREDHWNGYWTATLNW